VSLLLFLFRFAATVVSMCTLPPLMSAAPVVWLRENYGFAQVNNSAISEWTSVTFGTTASAFAPALDSRPTVVVDSASANTYLRFNGVKNALTLRNSLAPMQRPLTVFVVDRYSPMSTVAQRKRNLQGSKTYDAACCAVSSSSSVACYPALMLVVVALGIRDARVVFVACCPCCSFPIALAGGQW
jgi:hypothetical protein